MASSWGAAEVPVGDTSVVCFDYTLDGTLCEVCTCFPPSPSHARALNLPAVHLILTSFSRCSKNLSFHAMNPRICTKRESFRYPVVRMSICQQHMLCQQMQ